MEIEIIADFNLVGITKINFFLLFGSRHLPSDNNRKWRERIRMIADEILKF